MSQMKIWKIVKERREKKEAAQLAQDESRDQLAGEVGQDVEALNERSRAQWEAVYGNGSKGGTHQDSGVGTSLGSTHKKSTSVTTREVGPIEMDDYPDQSGSRQKRKSGARVGIITRSIRSAHRESRSNLAGSADWSSRRTSHNSGSSGAVPSQYEVSMPQKPGGPSMVPLPFSPPVEEDGEGHSSESIQHQGMSLNPLALKRLDEQSPARLRKIEDDRASSIAATADDEPELDQRSMGRPSLDLPTYDVGQSNRLLPNYEQIRDRSRTPSGQRSPQQETDVEEDDEEMLVRPLTARHDSEPPVTLRSTSNEGQHKRISSAGSHRRSIGSRDLSVVNEQNVGTTAHVAQDLTGHLPESISKVAMAYRTNEWAKHIADADQPDDTEEGPDSPGIQVDHAFREEAARPVDTAALSEVPVLTTTEGPRKAGTKPSKNPYRKSREAPPSVSRKTSGTPVYAFQRSDSQQSQQSLLHPSGRRDTRNASALVEAPLLESPGEETNLAAPSSTRSFSTPMGSSSNLLDQRNDRLERRTTTTSFAALGSGSRLNVLATDDSASAQGYESISRGPSPGADMTLAERRAFMQQQQLNAQAPTPKKARRSSGPAPSAARMHSANNPNLIYDSHQPRRSNTVDTNKQQNMFNQWRSSLQQNSNPQMPLVDQDQARQAMIVQQQQAAMDRQRRQSKRMQRESRMDVAMRTGQLHSAHTDVLRKMQAKANESAK